MSRITSAISLASAGRWIGLALVSLFASCRDSGVIHWQEFVSPEGKFKVLMPGRPIKQEPKTASEYEPVKWRIVSTLSNVSALSVSYSDQPTTQVFLRDPEKILDAIRDKAVEDLGGELLNERPIQYQKYPGRELQVRIQGGYTVRQRVILVNKRLYALMVVAGSTGVASSDAEKFFNSFQVLP